MKFKDILFISFAVVLFAAAAYASWLYDNWRIDNRIEQVQVKKSVSADYNKAYYEMGLRLGRSSTTLGVLKYITQHNICVGGIDTVAFRKYIDAEIKTASYDKVMLPK